MAKLKANDSGLWLVSGGEKDGVQVGAQVKSARWLEITVYDYDASSKQRFTVTIIDRSTGVGATASGKFHVDALSAARAEIGA